MVIFGAARVVVACLRSARYKEQDVAFFGFFFVLFCFLGECSSNTQRLK